MNTSPILFNTFTVFDIVLGVLITCIWIVFVYSKYLEGELNKVKALLNGTRTNQVIIDDNHDRLTDKHNKLVDDYADNISLVLVAVKELDGRLQKIEKS